MNEKTEFSPKCDRGGERMKAETDLYCQRCGNKIYDAGDKMMALFFTGSEERCMRCDTMLRRRTPGGQSDPFNFNTTKVTEREYVREWYFCQLKVDDELKDYDCKDPDGFPDCRTCEYQKKTNSEVERVAEECRE